MIIVLDASAAMEIALNRDWGDKFRAILRDSDLVVAPDTFPSEITNAFWKYASFSEVDKDLCAKGIDYSIDLVDDYIETRSMCREVFAESIANAHAAYDLFYLVLARRYGASLLTRDKKMQKLAAEMKVPVIHEAS